MGELPPGRPYAARVSPDGYVGVCFPVANWVGDTFTGHVERWWSLGTDNAGRVQLVGLTVEQVEDWREIEL